MAPPDSVDCVACAGGDPAVQPSNDKLAPSPYEVHVSAVSKGLKSELQAAEHSLALDAGHALGGQQSAPSPVQAFIASIVACTQVCWTGWRVLPGLGSYLASSWSHNSSFDCCTADHPANCGQGAQCGAAGKMPSRLLKPKAVSSRPYRLSALNGTESTHS